MIGKDIAEWRRRNGFTQEKLRLELDVTRQTVSGWENSSAPIPRVVELALAALEKMPELKVHHGRAATAEEKRRFSRSLQDRKET